MEERTAHRKVRTGTVVSDKMDKTIVVRVDRMAKHSLYGKPVLSSKKFMAHGRDKRLPRRRHRNDRRNPPPQRKEALGGS